MKLGINITGLFPGKNGGAEQYIRNIVKFIGDREDIQSFLFLNSEGIETFCENDRVKLFSVDISDNIEAQLTNYINDLNLDVWFCPLFHLNPPGCSIPSATAIFDVQQEFYPGNFSHIELATRRKNAKETLKNTDIVLTISEFSKQCIIEKYGFPEDRVIVTYLNSDSCFENKSLSENIQEIKQKYKLPEDYLLYPANSWPHKNHLNLINAFIILKNKGLDTKLVFTGAKKDTHRAVEKFIIKHHLQDDIIYLGYIPQDDMPCIFASAKMLVFPSLFEGFGIPLLEAMRSGIPIACSDSGSIPEICGDAAFYFDGNSVADIADKIFALYQSPDMQTDLVAKGYERAKDFSWDQCAEKTVMALNKIYIPQNLDTEVMPLVSIITPSYNQGKFIRSTIESVLNQDYPNIEYIVMDGGSTDETVSILKEYGDRIKWVSEKDGGQADAVNKGLVVAKGSVIGWLNSDDTYLDGAISKAVDYLLHHPRVDMVYGNGYYIDVHNNITGEYPTEPFSREKLAGRCIICQPCAFFRKKISDKVGGLDPNLQLCMDYELWMRFAFAGQISNIPDFLATSRLYAENKTLSRRVDIYKEACAVVRNYYSYVPFSWVSGYAYHLVKADIFAHIKLYFMLPMLFFWYNRSNLIYPIKHIVKAILRKPQETVAIPGPEGQYEDGFVGKSYEICLTCNSYFNSITIEGQNILRMEAPLQIEVFINDKHIESLTIIDLGTFAVNISLSQMSAGTYKVRLNMPITFTPHRSLLASDIRELSFKLNKLYIEKT